MYFIGNQIWIQNCVNKTKVHKIKQSSYIFVPYSLSKLRKFVTTLLAITRLLDFDVTTLPYPTQNWKTTTRWSLTAKRLTASSWHYWQLPRFFSSTRVLQRRADPISWKHFHGGLAPRTDCAEPGQWLVGQGCCPWSHKQINDTDDNKTPTAALDDLCHSPNSPFIEKQLYLK